MEIENLTEGWVKFRRIPAGDGHLDCWTGDLADNPNNPKQSLQHLNSFAQYYRKNGKGEWKSSRDVNRESVEEIYKSF